MNSGSIKVNDSDLREAHLETLRRNVAIVTQDVQLFRASIRDNLTFFDRSIPDEKIISTLEVLEHPAIAYGSPRGLFQMRAVGVEPHEACARMAVLVRPDNDGDAAGKFCKGL